MNPDQLNLSQLLATDEFQAVRTAISQEVSGGQGFFSVEMSTFTDMFSDDGENLTAEDCSAIRDITKVHRAYTSSLEAQVMSLCAMVVLERHGSDDLQDLIDDDDKRKKVAELIKAMTLGAFHMVNKLTHDTASQWGVDMSGGGDE